MTDHQAECIAAAIRSISHGPTEGPTGLEAVVLSLAGGFGGTSGDSVASGLHDVANAIRDLAAVLKSNKEAVP